MANPFNPFTNIMYQDFLDESSSNYQQQLVTAIAEEEEEEEEENATQQTRRGGSTPGHQVHHRNRALGHEQIWRDYFATDPTYYDTMFRRRFRMRRNLFIRIQSAIEAHDPYFLQKKDATGKLGLSSLQKITAAMMMLAYGRCGDSNDEYVRIAESTVIESLRRFVKAVNEVFGDQYRRSPNSDDIRRLLAVNEERGFPGMLGSIDCMHWQWKNCPVAWQGTFQGHVRKPTIILEAVASRDLWIWHSFFGLPGSLNDINVLGRSPIFNALADGRAPPVNYSINGHDYTMGYYLADGIYPRWSTFLKTISLPRGRKQKFFAKAQEGARKDVERAFGVLQERFGIVRGPARFWDRETLADIMYACVIMHNMIVEDEIGLERVKYDQLKGRKQVEQVTTKDISRGNPADFGELYRIHSEIRNTEIHSQLQLDLVEHLWQIYGSE